MMHSHDDLSYQKGGGGGGGSMYYITKRSGTVSQAQPLGSTLKALGAGFELATNGSQPGDIDH
jgi:hypothetical protein